MTIDYRAALIEIGNTLGVVPGDDDAYVARVVERVHGTDHAIRVKADRDTLGWQSRYTESLRVKAERERGSADHRALVVGALNVKLNTASAKIDALNRKLDDSRNAWLEERELRRELEQKLSMVTAGHEDVWKWIGDGSDDPDSLSCPVVMAPERLREMLTVIEAAINLIDQVPDLNDPVDSVAYVLYRKLSQAVDGLLAAQALRRPDSTS